MTSHRWSPFTEFPQERSSVNLVSCGGQLYAVGGFAVVENDNRECTPSEVIDIWQYVIFIQSLLCFSPPAAATQFGCFLFLRYEEDKKQWTGMIRELRYAAGASCVSMHLNTARMPKL